MDLLEISLPSETGATEHLADPVLLNYYEQLENRTLWIDSEIDDSTIEVAKKIMRWNSEDADHNIPIEERRPIKIMLSSSGGDTYTMLAIIDTIRLSQTPVYTCAVTLAASAACAILISGHKRFAFPYANVMWHSGSGGLTGTLQQIQSASKHLDDIEDKMQEFFLERTKVDIKKYRRQKDKDWYFDANEMLENGLIDSIVQSLDEIL